MIPTTSDSINKTFGELKAALDLSSAHNINHKFLEESIEIIQKPDVETRDIKRELRGIIQEVQKSIFPSATVDEDLSNKFHHIYYDLINIFTEINCNESASH